jgi:hypothetical protein
MKPYTYLVGWPEYNIWYYGVRYSQDCDPSDLWKPYKTSSAHVKKFVSENGDPTVIQVRKVFDNEIQARLWEHRVLKRLKVVGDARWLNKTDNKSIEPLFGQDHPHYGKIGSAHHCYGIKRSQQFIDNQSKHWREHNPMKDPQVVAKKIKKTSGDKHHMKNPEIASKVSGLNHYSKRQGYIQPKSTCQYCYNSYKPSNLIRHETACKRHLSSLVANTDSRVYNQL